MSNSDWTTFIKQSELNSEEKPNSSFHSSHFSEKISRPQICQTVDLLPNLKGGLKEETKKSKGYITAQFSRRRRNYSWRKRAKWKILKRMKILIKASEKTFLCKRVIAGRWLCLAAQPETEFSKGSNIRKDELLQYDVNDLRKVNDKTLPSFT